MKALVTGGGGFLGKAIIRRLLARGDTVRSFSRGDYPDLRALGIELVRGDLGDAEAVAAAVQGVDVVFHVAAKADIWGAYEDFYRANVTGTEHVIAACRQHGIDRLVYTSTPSVIYNRRDIEGGDESLPYPEKFEATYPQTKAHAEQLVRGANDESLGTVALRPHIVWGPEDTNLTPRLWARAEAGSLVTIGSGASLIDSTYIDNAADAHLLAGDKLAPGSPISGKVYFITNGEPLPVADLIDRIIGAAGYPPVKKQVPTWLALALGGATEAAYRLLGRQDEPRLTRFLVRQLSTAHWFDISAARRDLGYEPAVSIDQGIERLRKWAAARQIRRNP